MFTDLEFSKLISGQENVEDSIFHKAKCIIQASETERGGRDRERENENENEKEGERKRERETDRERDRDRKRENERERMREGERDGERERDCHSFVNNVAYNAIHFCIDN